MLLITNLQTTDSTNVFLQNLVQSKKRFNEDSILIDIPEYYTVCADYQSSGRGQKENVWFSDLGKNILLSTLVYPKIKAENQFLLNMSVALGVLDFCKKTIAPKGFSIKWPNDIYYNDAKIGGILIEHTVVGDSILYSIVGIGLNLNQTSFPSSLPNPISAFQIAGHTLDVDECKQLLLSELANRKVGDDKSFAKIKKEYLSVLFRINKSHQFIYKNQPISATIKEVNQYGMLCLTTENGDKIECGFKEIEYLI